MAIGGGVKNSLNSGIRGNQRDGQLTQCGICHKVTMPIANVNSVGVHLNE